MCCPAVTGSLEAAITWNKKKMGSSREESPGDSGLLTRLLSHLFFQPMLAEHLNTYYVQATCWVPGRQW